MSTRRQRKQQREGISEIKLSHPDRSGPDPTQETLLDIAAKRGASLQRAADARKAEFDASRKGEDDEILVGRLGDSILWSISLAMLHLTLDVLVQHQYAQEMNWRTVFSRAAQAFPVIFLLFYTLHPHPSPSGLLPQLPTKYQPLLHQLFFFVGSIAAGSYLIYITNEHGYYATMKRAPPVGCLWVWSVIELDLLWGIASLFGCAVYWRWNNYAFL